MAGTLVGSHGDSTDKKRQIKRVAAVARRHGLEAGSSEVTKMHVKGHSSGRGREKGWEKLQVFGKATSWKISPFYLSSTQIKNSQTPSCPTPTSQLSMTKTADKNAVQYK